MHTNDQKKLLKLIIKEAIVKEGILDAIKDTYANYKGNRAIAGSEGTRSSQKFFNQSFGKGAKFPMSMPQASFKGSTLKDIGLGQRDLTNASFENANLIRVDFQSANLTNTNFNGATLNDCRWDGANVSGARFENIIIMTSNGNPDNLNTEELLAEWIKDFKTATVNGKRVRFDNAQMPNGGPERAGFLRRGKEKEGAERLKKDKEAADRVMKTKDRYKISDYIQDLAKDKKDNYRDVLIYMREKLGPFHEREITDAIRNA